MSSDVVPFSRRRSFWFGISAALLSTAVITGSLLYIITGHPYRAVWVLAAGMGMLGLLRAVWPGDPWFVSRSRLADVLVYWAIALGLLLLSPGVSLMLY